MPQIVLWNRRYVTRIGLLPATPLGTGGTVQLKPGRNVVDDETFGRMKETQAFDRLQKDGALALGGPAKDTDTQNQAAVTPGTRALTSETLAETAFPSRPDELRTPPPEPPPLDKPDDLTTAKRIRR